MNDLEKIPTEQLVEELKKREGVNSCYKRPYRFKQVSTEIHERCVSNPYSERRDTMKTIQKEHMRLLNNLKLIASQTTYEEIAALLGVTQKTICQRMKELWRLFSFDDYWLICEHYKVDFNRFMTEELHIA
jgi:adenine C2-methylase RlmN of 23S rRNA A2503 and tRNA A37